LQHPSLKITFLGTGTSSGVPMIACYCDVCKSSDKKDKRLRSSVLIETNSTTLVIDTTPDFRYQMLRTATNKLDAVVFTHPHKDHIAGLDDVRAYNFFSGNPMQLYANELTANAIKKEMHYAFAEHKYPGVPNLILNHIDNDKFLVGDIELQPIKVWHLKMPVLGFRVGDFTYITDANRIDDEEKEKIVGSKMLVLNALRREKHISHFTLSEAIALAEELNIPEVYFTHISHQLGKHIDVNSELPRHIQLAYDGLVLEI
jgi:phosphoribosyl 1,2-cyclic phosphate phosphodiesterase